VAISDYTAASKAAWKVPSRICSPAYNLPGSRNGAGAPKLRQEKIVFFSDGKTMMNHHFFGINMDEPMNHQNLRKL
jgi:hypothetical protein